MTRWRWLGLVFVILALSYFLRIGFFTYALYVVLALVLSSRLMSIQSLRGIGHVRHCAVQRASIGDLVDVRVDIRHAGKLPVPWVLAEDLTPGDLPRGGQSAKVATLWPGGSIALRYQVECTRRGYHQLGPLLLESGDLFGLVRRFEAGDRAHYVLVHPQIVPIGGYDVTGPRPVGEVRAERRIYEDPTRLRGVREYLPGDKLSRIHWRSSAREGRLQTKVFEPSTMVGALLCLDMYAPAYDGQGVVERSELGVTAAASLAYYIASSSQQVGFLSNGRDAADRARFGQIDFQAATRTEALRLARMREESDRLRPLEVPVGRGTVTLTNVLDATARVELSDFQPVGAMLMREYPRLPRDVTLLVLTPRVDTVLLEALAALRQSGFVISVLVLSNPTAHGRSRGQLLGEGIPSYEIEGPHHLRELAAVRL